MRPVKTYLVVGGSSPIIPFIQHIKTLGYRVVACDRNPDAPCRAVADVFHPIDATSLDDVLALARHYEVSAVSTYAEVAPVGRTTGAGSLVGRAAVPIC